MKLQGSLACLLLALYLGSGEAGPLLSGGASVGTGLGEAIGHGVGDAIGHRIGEAIEEGVGEAASFGIRDAMGPGMSDAFGHRVGEAIRQGVEAAAHAFENSGRQAGRETENIIRHGTDAAHGSWQGMPGNNGAWGTNGQPPSGGSLGSHSQGNPGGPGTPWGQGYSGGSDGNFGTNSQGSSWGQGGNRGPYNVGTNAQGAVAQPGYGVVRGNSNPNVECQPSGSGGSSSGTGGSSSSGGSGGGSGGSGSGGSGGDNGGGSGSGSSGGNSGYSTSSSSSSSGGSGSNPGCDNPGNEVRVSGGSGGQGSRAQGGPRGSGDIREISTERSRLVEGFQGNYRGQGSYGAGETVNGINNLNSRTSSGLFDFDTFWKNLKSKLGFINWDAINQGQFPASSTRALLYFNRLWEDFKHNTPFLNWKAIIDDASPLSLQKRAGDAGQPGVGWAEVPNAKQNYNYNQQAYPTASSGQYSAKSPAKGRVTPSSSASRVQPGLLQWVKFW